MSRHMLILPKRENDVFCMFEFERVMSECAAGGQRPPTTPIFLSLSEHEVIMK